jgi:cytochrome c556
MKLRSLSIVIAFLAIGAGGKFAYDAYREHERQERLEVTGPVWGSVHQGISPGPKKHNDAESGSRCLP